MLDHEMPRPGRLKPAHPGECRRESVRAIESTIIEAARRLKVEPGHDVAPAQRKARLIAATALAVERLEQGDAGCRMRLQMSQGLAPERRKQ